jgi:hypothetical protein
MNREDLTKFEITTRHVSRDQEEVFDEKKKSQKSLRQSL